MKKWIAVIGLFLLPMLFVAKKVCADGNYSPALVTSTTTNQGYLYPITTYPVGGFLVGNGTLFNWSNSTVTSTTTATPQQIPAFPLMTTLQINALTPATTGQMVFCTNCTAANTTKGALCFSTGTAVNQWMEISSGTASSGCL